MVEGEGGRGPGSGVFKEKKRGGEERAWLREWTQVMVAGVRVGLG